MAGKPKKRRGRKPTDEITAPQRKTLSTIASMTGLMGYPPTLQELADRLGITVASTYGQVNQLIRKGYLKRQARKARSFEVVSMPTTDDPEMLVPVRIVGRVAAGRPILAEENVVGEVLVESRVAGRSPCFALSVQGDSMVDAGINDGDLCVVRQQPAAENGEVVVALIGDEATVKRLHLSEEGVELRPENPRHKPIPIAPDEDFRIVGKVVAVRRGSTGGCNTTY